MNLFYNKTEYFTLLKKKGNKLFVTLLMVFISIGLFAQSNVITIENASKRQLKQLDKAKKKYKKQEVLDALYVLEKLLKKHPNFIDGHLLEAVIYQGDLNRHEKKKIVALSRAIRLDSLYNKKALFSLGESLAKQGEYQNAMSCLVTLRKDEEFYKKYATDVDHWFEIVRFSILRLEAAEPLKIQPISSVNTEQPETFPTLTASGNTLYFGRIVNRQEDIYRSSFSAGQWNKAQRLANEVNTPTNESTQSLSSDGKTLVFSACQRNDSYGSCDLYISKNEGGKWTTPTNLGNIINSPSWESQPCLAEDGQVLYFASNRPGGSGGKDLYYSKKIKENWTKPINLGDVINTSGDEGAPFLHYSNRELYFMSNGHLGMGQLDIFMAKRSSGEAWDSVYHLPPPINSHLEEISLIINLQGDKAYYSKEKELSEGGFRNMDIFTFELPGLYRPTKSAFITGVITDVNGMILPNTSISIYSLTSDYKKDILSDDQGEFLLSIALTENYGIVVTRKNYVMHSEEFSFIQENELKEHAKKLNIKLSKIKDAILMLDKSYVLKNLFFETASSNLDKRSKKELDLLKVFLEENPNIGIELQGHTDNVGDKNDNLVLSQKRAESVKSYLIDSGIDVNRLTAKGYGESQNLVPNDNPINRAKNRRTAFKIH